jgi:hypothetical protein
MLFSSGTEPNGLGPFLFMFTITSPLFEDRESDSGLPVKENN